MKTITRFAGILLLTVGILLRIHAQDQFTNGLVAYYPFNGNANDESGNAHDATSFGATLTTDRFGQTNRAYYFDGNSYISCPPDVYFAGDFSVSGWANVPQIRLWARLLDFGNGPEDHVTLMLSVGDSGKPRGDVFGNANSVLSSIVLPLNNWVQVAWTLSGNSTVLYLNGKQVAQATWAATPAAVVRNKNWFGRDNWEDVPGSQGLRTIGVLDDIRIYNRALSSDEVVTLYEFERGPRVDLIKAVRPALTGLRPGTNYQLQLSGDLSTWTNLGSPFVATNFNMLYPQYWDLHTWDKLYFRLQIAQ